MLYRLLCIDEANGFAYWSPDYERLGCGLLVTASYSNHTCLPNVAKHRAGWKVGQAVGWRVRQFSGGSGSWRVGQVMDGWHNTRQATSHPTTFIV